MERSVSACAITRVVPARGRDSASRTGDGPSEVYRICWIGREAVHINIKPIADHEMPTRIGQYEIPRHAADGTVEALLFKRQLFFKRHGLCLSRIDGVYKRQPHGDQLDGTKHLTSTWRCHAKAVLMTSHEHGSDEICGKPWRCRLQHRTEFPVRVTNKVDPLKSRIPASEQ